MTEQEYKQTEACPGTCSTCYYWANAKLSDGMGGSWSEPSDEAPNSWIGECHRRSPIVVTPKYPWPMTFHHDFCGDYIANKAGK